MISIQRSNFPAVFRRRILTTLFWKKSFLFFTVYLFFWGVAVLALRVGGLNDLSYFGMGLPGIALIPGWAWLAARKEVPNDAILGAILDRDNHSGGLLMSSFETEIGPWSDRIGPLELPAVRWEVRPMLGSFAAAACFAVVSLLLPVETVHSMGGNRLNVDDFVRKLTSQLDVMREEKLLTVEEVEMKKRELDRIQKEADGMGPVKTFDALDHLADQINRKATEAAELAHRTTETLAKTEALSEKIREISGELDPSTTKSLMDGLAESIEEMLKENEQLAKDLQDQLAQNEQKEKGEGKENEKKDGENGQTPGENRDGTNGSEQEKKDALTESLQKMLHDKKMGDMTPEMLQKLCESMKQCQENSRRMCENLQNAGLPIDSEQLKKLAESRKVDKEEAERMLSDLWANCDGNEEGGQSGEEGKEKKNGPKVSPRFTKKQDWTTDPDAPPEDTRFEKEPDEEGAEFKAKYLPPSDLEAFRNSQKIGASISAPKANERPTSADAGSAIKETGGGIGTAHGQSIHPQHRGPVERYFSTP